MREFKDTLAVCMRARYDGGSRLSSSWRMVDGGILRSRVRSTGRSRSSSLVSIPQERNEGPHGGTEMAMSRVVEMEAWIRRRPLS